MPAAVPTRCLLEPDPAGRLAKRRISKALASFMLRTIGTPSAASKDRRGAQHVVTDKLAGVLGVLDAGHDALAADEAHPHRVPPREVRSVCCLSARENSYTRTTFYLEATSPAVRNMLCDDID